MTEPASIDPYLRAIEYQYGINIIGSWDRGSRAFNLHTEESDYDIRLCYTQPYSDYLTISQYTESIQGSGEMLETNPKSQIPTEKIEFQGWDIKRFIELLNDDNPSIFECLASPITYQTHPIFTDLSEYCLNRIHPINLWRHYHSATKSNYLDYILPEKDPSIKRHLFIFRNILFAQYIQSTHKFPPFDFDTLLEKTPLPEFTTTTKQDIQYLADEKRSGNGNQIPNKDFTKDIEIFIDSTIEYQDHIPEKTIDSEQLDTYLLNLIQSTTMFL